MLNISIVLYKPDEQQLISLVNELLQAKCLRRIFLVDNSPALSETLQGLHRDVKYIFNNANLGYGKAHNIAIRESVYYHTAYHLVMNDDILVKAADIDYLHAYMEAHPEVGQIMPKVLYPNGETQYLAKLLPTPFDVFARRFLPTCLTRRRNNHYELRDSGYNRPMNVPYLSGCFMFLRTEAVLQARLFDERYFMYPEDIDLTRTIHRNWLTLFLPSVTIIHNHAQASYHSPRMLLIHITNMCRYFNKWGWFYDPERRLYNRQTLDYIAKNQLT